MLLICFLEFISELSVGKRRKRLLAVDADDVVAERSPDDGRGFAHAEFEDRFVKRKYPSAPFEPTELAAVRRAPGVFRDLRCELSEIPSLFQAVRVTLDARESFRGFR